MTWFATQIVNNARNLPLNQNHSYGVNTYLDKVGAYHTDVADRVWQQAKEGEAFVDKNPQGYAGRFPQRGLPGARQ
jgi:hypothetical protein